MSLEESQIIDLTPVSSPSTSAKDRDVPESSPVTVKVGEISEKEEDVDWETSPFFIFNFYEKLPDELARLILHMLFLITSVYLIYLKQAHLCLGFLGFKGF